MIKPFFFKCKEVITLKVRIVVPYGERERAVIEWDSRVARKALFLDLGSAGLIIIH